MNIELIKKQIKELDKNNLFDLIVVECPIYSDNIDIQLLKDYIKYSEDDYFCTAYADMRYNTKNNKIAIGSEDYDVYSEYDKTDSIPLLNFCYENKDKIKQIIKDNL